MHKLLRMVWVVASVWVGTPASAQEPGFSEVLSAVVGVRAQIPDDARTAAVLGAERVGSGVVIDDNGLVVTIGYLILEAATVEILLPDEVAVPARILAYDHDSGFGLLRAQSALEVRAMPLGDSEKLAATDPVLVASFGGVKAVRPAKVASRRVFAGYWEYLLENAIFTAPAYPLFGGAALVDGDGSLLGVGSLAVSDAIAGHYMPGNMFVPIERLEPILGDLLAHGRSASTRRPWLGIYSEEVSGRLLVTRVADGGPAADAGITSGDIILAVAKQPVNSMEDFYRSVWNLGEAGTTIPITILRDSESADLNLKSIDRYEWLKLKP